MSTFVPQPVPFVVRAALDATEARDTDELLTVIAEDGTVEDRGRTYRGTAEIREWSDREFIGRHVALDDLSCVSHGDEHAVHAAVTGDDLVRQATLTFTVAGGLISRVRVDG